MPITLDHPTRERDGIYAAYPSDRRPPAKLRATIDYPAEHVSAASKRNGRR